MNIHLINKNKFIAELTEKDMKELDITYEEMDYSNIETRRVIWTVIDKIRESSGRDIDPSCNLLIEAVADSSGGCVLCFTIPEKCRALSAIKPPVLKKNSDNVIYEFENADALLDLIKVIGYKNFDKSSNVYTDKNRIRLIMKQLPGSDKKKIFEEYGTFVGQGSAIEARTVEYWKKSGKL